MSIDLNPSRCRKCSGIRRNRPLAAHREHRELTESALKMTDPEPSQEPPAELAEQGMSSEEEFDVSEDPLASGDNSNPFLRGYPTDTKLPRALNPPPQKSERAWKSLFILAFFCTALFYSFQMQHLRRLDKQINGLKGKVVLLEAELNSTLLRTPDEWFLQKLSNMTPTECSSMKSSCGDNSWTSCFFSLFPTMYNNIIVGKPKEESGHQKDPKEDEPADVDSITPKGQKDSKVMVEESSKGSLDDGSDRIYLQSLNQELFGHKGFQQN